MKKLFLCAVVVAGIAASARAAGSWRTDFGSAKTIAGARIAWSENFPETYEAQASDDGKKWRTVYSMAQEDGGVDIIYFAPTKTRYFQIQFGEGGAQNAAAVSRVDFLTPEDAPLLSAPYSDQGHPPAHAIDGDPKTFWAATGPWKIGPGTRTLSIQFKNPLELAGLRLHWGETFATVYRVEYAVGENWELAARVDNGGGGAEYVEFAKPISAASWRIVMDQTNVSGYHIFEVEFRGPGKLPDGRWEYARAAARLKKGRLPRWLDRVQEYWTVVGVPGSHTKTLLGESGTIEPVKGGASIMPYVLIGGRMFDASDVKLSQSLEDGFLPIPSTRWDAGSWSLSVQALADGAIGHATTYARYRIDAKKAFHGKIALALRPVQLTPIWQKGGMTKISDAEIFENGGKIGARADGRDALVSLTKPSGGWVSNLEQGEAAENIERGRNFKTRKIHDARGLASAAFLFNVDVPAGGHSDVVVAYPLDGTAEVPAEMRKSAAADYAHLLIERKKFWREELLDAKIEIPEKRLTDALTTNLAYILINADGPWLQPGPRNYARSWVRDGADMGMALLRMGHANSAAAFFDAVTPFVTDKGWVPFIIENGRNAAPFNDDGTGEGLEYDSNGEYAALAGQVAATTGDAAFAARAYPSTKQALEFLEKLIARQSGKDDKKLGYFGILPPSNSHEGYFPARRSYWDDFWALAGFKNGARLAEMLGNKADAARFAKDAENLRADIFASQIQIARDHHLDILPGAADLGDVDPTGSAVALTVAEEEQTLPRPLGPKTFEFYDEILKKRIALGATENFTPYEIRNAEALLRLGEPQKARDVLRYFTENATRPRAWNQWPEIVAPDPRAPSYLGDIPHTWIGAEYINATRALFLYEENDRLILGAGIDPAWLNKGVRVTNLPTRFGTVAYSLQCQAKTCALEVSGTAAPKGGIIFKLPAGLKTADSTPGADEIPIAKLPAKFALTKI